MFKSRSHVSNSDEGVFGRFNVRAVEINPDLTYFPPFSFVVFRSVLRMYRRPTQSGKQKDEKATWQIYAVQATLQNEVERMSLKHKGQRKIIKTS